MADNTAKAVQDLRVRKLHFTAPPTLTFATIQAGLIDVGTGLKGQCGEVGDDGFNVLLRFNAAAKTLTLGGAPPSSDPFVAGYCFVNMAGGGTTIAPITVGIRLQADGAWVSQSTDQKFNMPVFAEGRLDQLLILPVSKPTVIANLSADGNCIGSYNPSGVLAADSNGRCDSNPGTGVTSCQRWLTEASLTGYITLEDADSVKIPQLGLKSLCAVLEPASVTADQLSCARTNGKISAQGDFCAATYSAGGCADSVWIAMTLAASAVTLNDGSGTPQCNGSLLGATSADSGSGDGPSE